MIEVKRVELDLVAIRAAAASIEKTTVPMRAASAALEQITAPARAAIETHKRNIRISK